MALEHAAGMPNYSYTGTKNIPILFAGKTLQKLYASTVFGEISNTDVIGEIKGVGSEVVVRTVPDITLFDYKPGMKLPLQHPESPSVSFTIDYAKGYNYALDDVDEKEMDLKMMDRWASDAAIKMKQAIDTLVLANVYADVHASNKGLTAGLVSADVNLGVTGTPLQLTKANILDVIVDCGQVLDEQNVDPSGRYLVLPAWAVAMLKKSDYKDNSMTGVESPIANGKIGTIDSFTIYKSNLLAKTTDGADTTYNCLFGHKSAIAFAVQLTKTEMYRPQDTFANAVKGLTVFGFKTLLTPALGHLYVKK